MSPLEFERPASLAQALALHAQAAKGRVGGEDSDGCLWLAGGQSLLAAMKLGMVSPSVLIDLQDLPGLREIREEGDGGEGLYIAAMATHASVAASALVRRIAPGLASLAGGIADEQVRQMGTIGGSLAHNDPAACWPAGVLAAGATVLTDQREIAADDYFQGLYTTALQPGELIVGVRFPRLAGLHYLKFEQPASRFALVGVAVARTLDGQGRVALTGLGSGVQRWPQAEQALGRHFSAQALQALSTQGLQALADLHASADYRRHLAGVLAGRCVTALGGGALPPPAPLARRQRTDAVAAPQEAVPEDGFGGVQMLAGEPAQVWQTLLDARQLQASIPGCEALVQTSPEAYEATVKVGLGPLSVRFKSEVLLSDQRPPQSLTLVFRGSAGALGSGQGRARVRLEPVGGQTRLHWWVQVQLSGRLAQFGNRLVEATARKLSGEFFERMGQALPSDASPRPIVQTASWWRRLLQFFFPSLGK